METGYLWLTLALFFFLMRTGAAIALTAVTFPAIRKESYDEFRTVFRQYLLRRLRSVEPLGLVSVGFLLLLLRQPMYVLRPGVLLSMILFLSLLGAFVLTSVMVLGHLLRGRISPGLVRMVATIHWLDTILWLAGSSLVCYALVEVVGLI